MQRATVSMKAKSQTQTGLKQQAKMLKKESLMKTGKIKKITSHPDLELAKEASKVHAFNDDAREHLLQDGHNPFRVELGFGQKAVRWAKGNRLVSIPLSILAGVVTTAIVKAVIGSKEQKAE